MTVTELLVTAFNAGMANDVELHEKWIWVTHKLAADSGVAHMGAVASDSRLDMLLRVMELERLERLKAAEAGEVDFADDIFMSLSECWVLRAYEVIRATWERHGRPKEGKIYTLVERLGLVRMPIAKGEIQQAKKAPGPILLVNIDGSEIKPYAADGSYVMPRGICGATGAALWIVANIKSGGSVEICRRDLSNEFLGLFD
ncbi:hypothetical protein [Sphingobium vermicomposti]|uniref:Uncharacterized protein n=1 Tax=Sphingobium vermicomposti TaxID=529005 RepID=A0A846MH19_9SPHN|nr:hypothetical protein [Sphingobium vermicomposti]NIJ16556.1 hypothetical protein [Sphingobium vermicomposti]